MARGSISPVPFMCWQAGGCVYLVTEEDRKTDPVSDDQRCFSLACPLEHPGARPRLVPIPPICLLRTTGIPDRPLTGAIPTSLPPLSPPLLLPSHPVRTVAPNTGLLSSCSSLMLFPPRYFWIPSSSYFTAATTRLPRRAYFLETPPTVRTRFHSRCDKGCFLR